MNYDHWTCSSKRKLFILNLKYGACEEFRSGFELQAKEFIDQKKNAFDMEISQGYLKQRLELDCKIYLYF